MTNEKILEILKAPREDFKEVVRRANTKSMGIDSSQKYAFFSYSHNDASKVSEIFKKLYEKGYNIWLDVANLSHSHTGWDDEARTALMDPNCTLVVFFRSEASVLSENVYEEISEADTKQRFNEKHGLPFSINVVDIWGEGKNCDEYQKAIKDLRLGMALESYTDDEKELIMSAESRLNRLYKIVKTSANAIQGEVENITMEIMEEFDKHHIYKTPTVQKPQPQPQPQPQALPTPKAKAEPPQLDGEFLTTEHILTSTEPKYKIFTFGPSLHIGFGIPMTVCYKGKSYESKTHSSTKGRIDGISKLFNDSPELQAGVAIIGKLDCSQHILTVTVK